MPKPNMAKVQKKVNQSAKKPSPGHPKGAKADRKGIAKKGR